MSNSMNLDLPVVSTTPGPEWATKVNQALLDVAEHTHTTGDGVKITPVGMNINSNLEFNNSSVLNMKSLRLQNQVVPIADPADISCVYQIGGDLYWRNAAGTSVQLTSGGGINIASVGTIGGDYGGVGVTASVAYSDVTKTFTFLQATGQGAKMFTGTLNVANETFGSLAVSIGADASTSAYALVLPVAAPATDSVLTFSSAGVGTFRTITGTAGEVTVTPSTGTHQVSLPSTISKSITFSGNNTYSGTSSFTNTETHSGSVTFSGNTTGRGILPVGAVIPILSHLAGTTNVTATTTADANGFVVCGGQTISDATSPMNGVVIPNINDSVFLMGASTSSSTIVGSNSRTLTTAELPSHTHTMNHGHSNSFGLTGTTTFAADGHTHNMEHAHQFATVNPATSAIDALRSISSSQGAFSDTDEFLGRGTFQTGTGSSNESMRWFQSVSSSTRYYTSGALNNSLGLVSNTGSNSSSASVGFSGSVTSHSGDTGSNGSGSAFDIRPKYISAKYIIRIK